MIFIKAYKILYPIYYDCKALNVAQNQYPVIEQELLAIVISFEKYQLYMLGTTTIRHVYY